MSEVYRLDKKKVDTLIAYLQGKGFNAQVRVVEGFDDVDGFEILEAMTKEDKPVRYHWSTNQFKTISDYSCFKRIDKLIPKKRKSREKK